MEPRLQEVCGLWLLQGSDYLDTESVFTIPFILKPKTQSSCLMQLPFNKVLHVYFCQDCKKDIVKNHDVINDHRVPAFVGCSGVFKPH